MSDDEPTFVWGDYNSVQGVRIDPLTGKPMDCAEIDHFVTCAQCGQSVDLRNLMQVLHHQMEGHQPLPRH